MSSYSQRFRLNVTGTDELRHTKRKTPKKNFLLSKEGGRTGCLNTQNCHQKLYISTYNLKDKQKKLFTEQRAGMSDYGQN